MDDGGSLVHGHGDSLEVQQQRANGGTQNGGSLGQEHGDTLASVDGALGHEAASEETGSETGVPTRTSPATPPLLSHAHPPMGQFWFMHPPNK